MAKWIDQFPDEDEMNNPTEPELLPDLPEPSFYMKWEFHGDSDYGKYVFADSKDECSGDGWEAIYNDDQMREYGALCRTAAKPGAVACYRWSRDGVPTCGWIDGVPSERQFQAQRECKDFATWTIEYAYGRPLLPANPQGGKGEG